MKKIIVLVCVCLASCSKDSNGVDPALVGTWRLNDLSLVSTSTTVSIDVLATFASFASDTLTKEHVITCYKSITMVFNEDETFSLSRDDKSAFCTMDIKEANGAYLLSGQRMKFVPATTTIVKVAGTSIVNYNYSIEEDGDLKIFGPFLDGNLGIYFTKQ